MNARLKIFQAVLVALCPCFVAGRSVADDGEVFFELKVRPVLVEHCYRCHSEVADEIKGGLRLDLKTGWQLGGDSGEPAVISGKPDESLLIRSIRHQAGVAAMPPLHPKLPEAIIADLTQWVKMGATDPRDGRMVANDKSHQWEEEFQQRLDWWSLKPIIANVVPSSPTSSWVRTELDSFILAKLESHGLQPSPEATRTAIARRLSFALTGLPPNLQLVNRFVSDTNPEAYDNLISALLDSPHFGERWARHWMDLVHYSDTHGYEWDVPAKNAWRYRDYLIDAFNKDVPYTRLILEQIAGDLLDPRIDPETGVNQALIGPMMLRLGERRHGDNSAAEGVAQEAVSNMIDTLGKAFLGTTLACAQCHDHKLDAVEQRDYYSLAGMLMSTRFSARTVDTSDPNSVILEQLQTIKRSLQLELGRQFLKSTEVEQGEAREVLQAIKPVDKNSGTFPTSLGDFWKRSQLTPVTAAEFDQERQRRIAANKANLELLADFTRVDGAGGWRWDGFGMKHGLVGDGEIVIADEGEVAIQQLLPAGRYSHVWSSRMAGSLQSPQMDTTEPIAFSIELVSGKFASQSFIVDRALNPERLQFPKNPLPKWQTLTAGNFDSLEGTIDRSPRRVYFELATKSLNNYFPPRVSYGGLSEAEVADPRSWFGVTRAYRHPAGQPPVDELTRFVPLFDLISYEADWSRRLTLLLRNSVERWAQGMCTSEDVKLINDALHLKLLSNDLANTEVQRLVAEYRELEKRIQPDRTVGSTDDWNEGRDERIGIRGSYTDFGAAVSRGHVRFLSTVGLEQPTSSGRLEWARHIVSKQNPLVARVYVNRVWHYLFGAGLVRTTDDFGHLGEPPSHPELLDYLASRFVEEGWSTKKLIRLMVSSAVWRQQSVSDPRGVEVDPENRLWHHMPLRRLEAEAIRDSLLAVSGRLDAKLYGEPIEPYRTAEDSQKRLFKGPLDGEGRRSIYTEMTMMEPPRFLALFNQPLPKQTVGRRDVTNVPDQALALLNDPFVIEMARCWSIRLLADRNETVEQRIEHMIQQALSRPVRPEEVASLLKLVKQTHQLRDESENVISQQPVWQDAAHALFNLKEFIYVP